MSTIGLDRAGLEFMLNKVVLTIICDIFF